MSVGGYGGFSDAMRCDDALLLACCGSDWGGAGRSWKRRHSIVKGKGRVFMKEKAWKAESGFKKFNYIFFCFLFFKLCWCGKLWKFQKLRLYIYIYINYYLLFLFGLSLKYWQGSGGAKWKFFTSWHAQGIVRIPWQLSLLFEKLKKCRIRSKNWLKKNHCFLLLHFYHTSATRKGKPKWLSYDQ